MASDYPRRTLPIFEPSGMTKDNARHELGNAWRDQQNALQRLTGAVLWLYDFDPEALAEAVDFHGLPSVEVNRILVKYGRIRSRR